MPTSSSSRHNLDGCSIITFKSCSSFDSDEKIENEKIARDEGKEAEEEEEKNRTATSTKEEKLLTTIAQTTTRLNCFTVRNRCSLLLPLSSRLIFLSCNRFSSFLYFRFIYYSGLLLYVFDFIVRFALHIWLIRHKLVYYKETYSI